jgi:hypothetical protein
MGTVEMTRDLPITGGWDKQLAEWFQEVVDVLVRSRAKSGLSDLMVMTTLNSVWGPKGQRLNTIIHGVHLDARQPQAALQSFAEGFSGGGAVDYQGVSYIPVTVAVRLDFKDPGKAVLFKLTLG